MTGRDAHELEAADKWEVQLRKGCLELAILAALWDGKRYGLEILRRLESDSDLIVSEGTVYPLLSRLKALGLVRSEWVESEAGHPRKYYALTAAGKTAACGRWRGSGRGFRRAWTSCWLRSGKGK